MMWKKLFDFKLSRKMIIAKAFMYVCILAAIVITGFGLADIMDVAKMKEVLGVKKPLMGDVLLYLLKKYLSWALGALVVGIGTFVGVRFTENNWHEARNA